MDLSRFSLELIVEIGKWLKTKDKQHLRLTCKDYYDILNDVVTDQLMSHQKVHYYCLKSFYEFSKCTFVNSPCGIGIKYVICALCKQFNLSLTVISNHTISAKEWLNYALPFKINDILILKGYVSLDKYIIRNKEKMSYTPTTEWSTRIKNGTLLVIDDMRYESIISRLCLLNDLYLTNNNSRVIYIPKEGQKNYINQLNFLLISGIINDIDMNIDNIFKILRPYEKYVDIKEEDNNVIRLIKIVDDYLKPNITFKIE